MIFLNTLSIIITLLTWNDVSASEWWNGWSLNDNNDRYQREPIPVTLTTTKTEFKQLWYTKLNGPVSMSPTVYEHSVYVATFTGMFYCLQANNGIILWQRNLSDIINNGYAYLSRTSPLIYNNMIISGLIDSNIEALIVGHGCHVIAFDRFNGTLLWQTKVSSHPMCRVTSSPRLVNDLLFIGLASREEAFASDPAYPCCTFQGSVIALNASTGTFVWETKLLPDNNGTTNGYSGAPVWGSQFPVDYKRNQIYIATGNYYKLPASVQKCKNDTINLTLYSEPCNQADAYGEAILALDMNTGLIRWSRKLGPIDAWNGGCTNHGIPINDNCPPFPGPDVDFAQAPILKLDFRYKLGGKNRDQLFIGQKSGTAYDLDAETGTVIWSNHVSPASNIGGMQFGCAADDQYLYVGNNNFFRLNYTLPNGTITNEASWSALDLVTGDVRWTTVDPTMNVKQTSAYQALTVWDQLVLVQGGSPPRQREPPLGGCLYGLNKANGEILYEWCIENTPLGSGASVVKNTIYVSVGYVNPIEATDGLVALQLPGYNEISAATSPVSSRKTLLLFCHLSLFYLFLFF